MKCTNFVCPFDQFRRPAPIRPPGSKHPWGPRLGWYRFRPGASRKGEYPNGSNIKNSLFMKKCTKFVGPFDPFRRPAPGRPSGSKHPLGPKLRWYRSRPGASRRGEYPNGSNIKNIRLWWNAPISLVYLTHSDGLPIDDLLVPSTHGDLDWAGIGTVLGQAVGANIQMGPTSKISVWWWNAPISLVHLSHSDGLPHDDLLVPSIHENLDWAGIVPSWGKP